ncbi:MAG: aminotransferase class I/II-fold pyridoxal phosphate-dependent enzyme, partial [Chloroflexi bacterium]|nr:aminotransferase class I/II-fold pyridoxal phosphate-dependent enzyme [Chloroflexota bacterium]
MTDATGIERFIKPKYAPTGKGAPFSIPPTPPGVINLALNENHYGASPKIGERLANYPDLNLYPNAKELQKLIAGYAGVAEEYVVPANGGSQILDLIANAFVGDGDEVIHCPPTFHVFAQRAQFHGGSIVSVPRDENFAVNVAAVKAAITDKTKIIVIVNPNNPTGTLTSKKDILEIVDTGVPVLLDEAYAEFAGETVIDLVAKYDNLMVMRTFSKWAALAGMRVGFAVVAPVIAQSIARITMPFFIDQISAVAVQESLKDIDYLMGNVKLIVEQRERLSAELGKFNFLKPYPSAGNFVCCA